MREKIRVHPLITDKEAWQRERPFRLAVIEQCSYDGTIYNAQTIIEKLGPLCDYILFDEAWAGFMKFHPTIGANSPWGLEGLDAAHPGIIATQSTHKQLAGFSQARQIHVKDSHINGQRRRAEHRRFNEMFMMHSSTSPFYPLFASLDVDAQMHKGRNGLALWDDAVRIGIETAQEAARALRPNRRQRMTSARWFFDPFVPDMARA